MDTIEGRVIGVRPEQRIVLYAKSGGRWWIQPFARDPLFTKIQGDSKWKNVTHLGEEYAALLVDPSYSPPQTTGLLPATGGAVAAVAVVKGQTADPSSPPKMLHFSGYDWLVRDLLSYRGGSMNSFDPANAWTDAKIRPACSGSEHRMAWLFSAPVVFKFPVNFRNCCADKYSALQKTRMDGSGSQPRTTSCGRNVTDSPPACSEQPMSASMARQMVCAASRG